MIRQRLGPEIYQGVLEVVLTALKAHGLFKGRHLGIDSSVIEANASLRTLVHRNTEQAYWEYVKELAEKEGVDPQDEAAVRRFAAQGIDIKYYHRPDRTGFKAGALEAGLKVARGEFIAIFDADFLPSPDFLHRLLPHFG